MGRFLKVRAVAAGLLAILAAATAVPCGAVIVFEKGKSTPVRGYLVSEDALRIVIREVLPDGTTQERSVLKSAVDDVIRAVSAERLAALNREKPQGYRDYAEELAEKREDPEARVTAIRLFLIAAHLEPEKLGRSSLLGMVALARSPAEERRFRALAFLLDRDHDRSILREPARGALDVATLSREVRAQLSAMLRALREGRADDARGMAKRPALAAGLPQVARIMTPGDFATLRNGARLPPTLLRQIVSLELLLAGEVDNGDEAASGLRRSGWSQIHDPANAAVVPMLTLATVTEFHPADCHFRDGKWVPE